MNINDYTNKIRELSEVRNRLLEWGSIPDLLGNTAEIIQKLVKCQSVSVFLLAKDGSLERRAIYGFDKDGDVISNGWFSWEKYQLGRSFTGRTVVPFRQSKFGEPSYSNNLAKSEINTESREQYLEKLGFLGSAISYPLNGRHRTFGVLEIINKLSKNNAANPNSRFSEGDIFWIAQIGNNLASAISDIRKRNELFILSQLGEILVQSLNQQSDDKLIYTKIASLLVGELTCYKACIIRVGSDENKLHTVGKGGDGINWKLRVDLPLGKGERLIGSLYKDGKEFYLSEIAGHLKDFKNKEWIVENKLKSYCCIPLKIKDITLGTISLFSGFHQTFCEEDKQFLTSVSSIVVTYINSSGIISDNVDSEALLARTRTVSFDGSVHKLQHGFKHKLMDIQTQLEEMQVQSPSTKNTSIKRLVRYTQNEIEKINKSFDTKRFSVVDVNSLLSKVLKSLGRKLTISKIAVDKNFYSDLPELLFDKDNLMEIFRNIIYNAIKALELTNKKERKISLETKLVKDPRRPLSININITDNGIGIKNEDIAKIYDREYTTFPGGTGVGLYISKEILNNLGCKIDCDSTFGKGTTFKIFIPYKRNKLKGNNDGQQGYKEPKIQ